MCVATIIARRTALLTGRQVREACRLLHWDRFDLQRWTALPLTVVDRALASGDGIGETLADEIIFKNAFYRAGIEFMAESGARLRKSEASE